MQIVVEGSTCRHCTAPLLPGQNGFCCQGCETVFQVLQGNGLEKFYELRRLAVGASSDSRRPSIVSSEIPRPFAAWSDPSFYSNYVRDGIFRTFLEGVHCLGCLWLIENLPTRVLGLSSARLDLGRSVATFQITDGADLEELAEEIASYGYRPIPLKSDDSRETQVRKLSRMELIRLGVAGLCASNIMLSSIPLYSGVGPELEQLFVILSGSLFLPVLGFSAVPFFQNAIRSVKRRALSIDLPIAVAIGGGALYSYWNLLKGSADIYFDSLSMIVFLLLAVRLALKRIQSEALTPVGNSLESTTVSRRESDGQLRFLTAGEVREGDWIELGGDQIVPFDGILRSKQGLLDTSVLTGEPFPKLTVWGETVYAGSKVQSEHAVVEVTAKGEQTRLGQILTQATTASLRDSRWVSLADRVGFGFVLGVFAVIFIVVVLGGGESVSDTVRRVLAISVVSCPCAFAFAAPLAFAVGVRQLASRGVIVGSAVALEKLAGIREVFLDKTGTLTEGRLHVVEWLWEPGVDRDRSRAAIVALERLSRHPIARAIVRDLSERTPAVIAHPVIGFRETPGVGVDGSVDGDHYVIRRSDSPQSDGQTAIAILRKGREGFQKLATAKLEDALRKDSADAVRSFQDLGITPWLLSGDSDSAVKQIAKEVGIDLDHALARLSPEQKAARLASFKGTAMVGDGANDAIALSAADVGIAVSGGVEASLAASDLYLTQPGVSPVVTLIRFARRLRRVVLCNLVLSTLFNAVAISLAASGRLSPLFAAIFMPVSSFSVLLVTWVGMRRPRC